VPARIAKGDLEGKMKARIWRKLHAEEAKRFDDAYAAMAKTPGLTLADAFALVQSGMSVEELRARRTRTQKREQVKQARKAVPNAPVEALLARVIEQKAELTFVLAERAVIDTIASVAPVSLHLGRSGKLEKLQVVLIAPRAVWEKVGPAIEREPKLAQKPLPVAREPDRRPYSDPRAFEAGVGKKVRLVLRNGITLEAPFKALGAFDLIVELDGQDALVPIHAITRWEPLGG
jgi:hypothetical protein